MMSGAKIVRIDRKPKAVQHERNLEQDERTLVKLLEKHGIPLHRRVPWVTDDDRKVGAYFQRSNPFMPSVDEILDAYEAYAEEKLIDDSDKGVAIEIPNLSRIEEYTPLWSEFKGWRRHLLVLSFENGGTAIISDGFNSKYVADFNRLRAPASAAAQA